MRTFRADVVESAARRGAKIRELGEDEARALAARIVARFSDESGRASALWDTLHDARAIRWPSPRSLAVLSEYLGEQPCSLLVQEVYQRWSAIHFERGDDLGITIDDCPVSFVFYVVPDDMSFVLAMTDHEGLLGAGAAVNWQLFRTVET